LDHRVRMTAAIPIELELWTPTEIFEANETALSGPFRIDDENEGQKVERVVVASLSSVYGENTYRSVAVRSGSASRELIDALAFDQNSICLVEAKATAVLATDSERPSARRAASATKQVMKALRQLRGALAKIRSNEDLYTEDGTRLLLPHRDELPAHAIVLLSEMYAFVDWKRVAQDVIALSENERDRALFHVFDVLELNNIVRHSKDPMMFNQFLIQRWVGVKVKGTAYGRVAKRNPDERE
jgi:hypothetical protein